MQGGGTINADGFGVAWWIPATPMVASRYRNAAPIWTDPAIDEVLPQLCSTAVLAAVRSATLGMPVERAACAPFTHGRWAFSHNGAVPDWRRALSAVAAQVDSPSLLEAESAMDSAALWVILRGLLGSSSSVVSITVSSSGAVLSGHTSDDAVAHALRTLVHVVLAESPTARLNLLLGDGATLWATTWHHSLSVLVTDTTAVISSEPYDDDPRWQSIPDRRLVTARPGRLSVASLESDDTERACS
jgi:gamma-glutamyl hercynylcysteine S-oxide hydrolase